jgi:hypothetical protein
MVRTMRKGPREGKAGSLSHRNDPFITERVSGHLT